MGLNRKDMELPLYRCFKGDREFRRCNACASPLDFPLSDVAAESMIGSMSRRGLDPIKNKVGAADPAGDVDRLRLVQRAAGPATRISADANEAWDWPTALARLEIFKAAGISLAYIENQIYRTDFGGLRQLTTRSPKSEIGHDYLRMTTRGRV